MSTFDRCGPRFPASAFPKYQRGVSTVLLAVALIMLLAFAALAVDGSNLYVARNELHNAADAGALAGARVLYNADGSSVNPGANAVAEQAAMNNTSQKSPVEVARVQRGHWSFATRTFTPNPSLEPVDLFSSTTEELDLNPDFINAIEVVSERRATPVQAFFGGVLGLASYEVSARAVAYVGFAGSLRPEDVDQPIGICKQALVGDDGYNCSVGRFIPSNDSAMSDTGGWTTFLQNVSGAASANTVKDLTCADGNPQEMLYGEPTQSTNGQLQAAFDLLYKCWVEQTERKRLWNMTLPVLDCPDGQVGPSNDLVGAVNLNVVWVVNQANKINDDAPRQMQLPPPDAGSPSPGDWSNDTADGITRWNDFVTRYDLQKPDGSLALHDSHSPSSGWQQKTIYFLPDCSYHEPKGQTGGENYGVLARIPVLVQ